VSLVLRGGQEVEERMRPLRQNRYRRRHARHAWRPRPAPGRATQHHGRCGKTQAAPRRPKGNITVAFSLVRP
jgi:hypothetical protein